MTDATKKIFKAPWDIFADQDEYDFHIEDCNGDTVAVVRDFDQACRILHLPELYEALEKANKTLNNNETEILLQKIRRFL